MADFILSTDGGARGNPGHAGVGAVIYDSAHTKRGEVSKYIGEQTNNFAEYEAVALGLQKLKAVVGKDKTKNIRVELRLDSELVAKQLRGEYQIKEESLFPQYIKVHNMRVADFPQLTITYIPREENKEADALANLAMDQGTGTLL